MGTRVPMLGSKYFGSQLYRTWPIFSWFTCTICGKEFRRVWMWKFLKRKNYALERTTFKYACFDCATSNYNDAVVILDKHFQGLHFAMLGVKPP
jgi:hypothetical protein